MDARMSPLSPRRFSGYGLLITVLAHLSTE